MKIIFNDENITDGNNSELYVYLDDDITKLFLFLDKLVLNEKELELRCNSDKPLAKKIYEIISSEFTTEEI